MIKELGSNGTHGNPLYTSMAWITLWCYLVFNDLRSEVIGLLLMIVRFVDIGRIVDHHGLNVVFLMNTMSMKKIILIFTRSETD
jgi:hypothetical protein